MPADSLFLRREQLATLGGCVAAFLILVALQVHGYSISMWREYLDVAPTGPEHVFGKARAVRGDDWSHDLPMVFAQERHSPRFPRTNALIGMGTQMAAPNKVPVSGPLFLIRPSQWGYVFGPNIGMAWQWQWLIWGLFYAFFLSAFLMSGGDTRLSLAAGAVMVFNPFFQFWSFHKAEIAIHAAGIFIGLWAIFKCQKWRAIWAGAIIVALSSVGFVLHQMYPPYQIPVLYGVVLAALALLGKPAIALFRERKSQPFFALGCALAFALIVGLWFYVDNRELIHILLGTSYPGQRVSQGGTLSLANLVASDFFAAALVKDWRRLGNVCEAASAFLWSPLVLIASIWITAQSKRRFPVQWALIGFLAFCFWFACMGVPAWLAHLTGFSKVPSNRLAMAIAIVDWFVVFTFLALPASQRALSKNGIVVSLATLAALLGAIAFSVGDRFTGVSLSLFIAVIAAHVCLGALFLVPGYRSAFLGLWVLLGFAYTAFFNPVVRGGFEIFLESPLARKMKEIDSETSGGTVWITPFHSDDPASKGHSRVLSSLPRVLGLRSIDGAVGHPNVQAWESLDPKRQFIDRYNQSGFTLFRMEDRQGIAFAPFTPGEWVATIAPSERALKTLGVTHLLVGSNRDWFRKQTSLRLLYEGSRGDLYELVK